MKAKAAPDRKQIAINHILPAIVGLWRQNLPPDEPLDIELAATVNISLHKFLRLIHCIVWQTILDWIRNNWRLKKAADKKIKLKVKRSDALWVLHREMVFEEIASILGLPSASQATPKWFQTRMKAIGNILRRMSDEEKQALDDEVREIAENGYPEPERAKYVIL